MKKWLSSDLFDFRWKKMTKWQRLILVLSFVFMGLSVGVLLAGAILCSDSEDVLLLSMVVGFFLFVCSTPFVQETMQIEGRINQKYLSEMNEIRKSLGRKEWEDV